MHNLCSCFLFKYSTVDPKYLNKFEYRLNFHIIPNINIVNISTSFETVQLYFYFSKFAIAMSNSELVNTLTTNI